MTSCRGQSFPPRHVFTVQRLSSHWALGTQTSPSHLVETFTPPKETSTPPLMSHAPSLMTPGRQTGALVEFCGPWNKEIEAGELSITDSATQ